VGGLGGGGGGDRVGGGAVERMNNRLQTHKKI
jgi:hypothetical protein